MGHNYMSSVTCASGGRGPVCLAGLCSILHAANTSDITTLKSIIGSVRGQESDDDNLSELRLLSGESDQRILFICADILVIIMCHVLCVLAEEGVPVMSYVLCYSHHVLCLTHMSLRARDHLGHK